MSDNARKDDEDGRKPAEDNRDIFEKVLDGADNWVSGAKTADGAFMRGSTVGLGLFLGQRGVRKLLRRGRPIEQAITGPVKAGAAMITTGYPNEWAWRYKNRKKK